MRTFFIDREDTQAPYAGLSVGALVPVYSSALARQLATFISPLNRQASRMAKSLVIVESPAKAKTINTYLGADFIVDASVDNVKDLPKAGLSIDREGGFVPTYGMIRGKEDVIARLRSLASTCDRV